MAELVGTPPDSSRIREARADDVPELGRVMVASWLAAHRGQMPDSAWQKRVAEWTPDVSARGWARVLASQAEAQVPDEVLLVAEDSDGVLVGLVHGVITDESPGPSVGQISSLYVAPERHRRGLGAALLRAAAAALRDHGVATLRLDVLTANLPARRFYDAMGGLEVGHGTTDEEGYVLATTVYEWPEVAALAQVDGS